MGDELGSIRIFSKGREIGFAFSFWLCAPGRLAAWPVLRIGLYVLVMLVAVSMFLEMAGDISRTKAHRRNRDRWLSGGWECAGFDSRLLTTDEIGFAFLFWLCALGGFGATWPPRLRLGLCMLMMLLTVSIFLRWPETLRLCGRKCIGGIVTVTQARRPVG